jgi:hypothetical protein
MKRRSVYCIELLKQWNKRRASEMTDLFAEDGNLVGFDGSQINGRSEARSVLSQIFPITRLPHIWESLRQKIRAFHLDFIRQQLKTKEDNL